MIHIKTVSFAGTRRFLLLGGGATCAHFARICDDMGVEVCVATSPRHAREIVDGVDFVGWLSERGIVCHVHQKLDHDFIREEAVHGTLAVCFGAAWIIKADLIQALQGRIVNVHAAPLPLYRGAGGFSWRIMNGDDRGALCIHLVNEGLDTGPVVRMETFTFPRSCRTPADLHAHTMERNLAFLKTFALDVLREVDFGIEAQDEWRATYFPRLNTDRQGWIDWSWSVQNVCRFIDAFDAPYGGASSMLGARRIRLLSCDMADDGPMHPFMAGLVYRMEEDAVCVAASGGGLRLRQVCDQEGENLVGKLRLGDRFVTPVARLEEARAYRPVYTPRGLQQDGG